MHIPKNLLEPLAINGMQGRLLKLPARNGNSKQILLIYGIHSSHERMYAMAQFLSNYGTVTQPDLPGIGGMDSFYSCNQTVTLDSYADYLYTFLKIRGLNHKVVVVAMSFGFLVVTRMLQRHKDSRDWLEHVISFVGFGRSADFKNLASRRRYSVPISRVLSSRLGSWLTSTLVFNPLSLRLMFALFRLFNPKYQLPSRAARRESQQMELDLWQRNDARTRFAIYDLFFNFDLTKHKEKLGLDLHDMSTPHDQYFDAKRVNQSLELLYERVTVSSARIQLHAPSIIGTEQDVSAVFTDEAKAILAR